MVKFGVEIEGIIDINKSKNTHISFNKDFSIKRDGSLSVTPEDRINFINPITTEIITRIFTDKQEFLKAIDNFIKRYSYNGKYKLNDVFNFNKSCGCHIHISFDGKKIGYFKSNTHFKLLKDVREYYFNRIKNSKTKSKNDILKHYYRVYSRKTTARNMLNGIRYKEFNFCSDLQGKGLEMRGTNILNIKSWKEFKEQMAILFETAEYLEQTFKKKFKIEKTIIINKKDYSYTDREPIIITGKD